jgi:glycosyltransferase involved in cell wall biosynthesis
MYLMKNCDLTVILSQTEIALLKEEESLKDSALIFLPLIVDVPGRTSNFKSRENILFVGGYNHPPNVDAVLYFAREVMPILRKKKAGLIFQVLGSNPPQEVQNLASEDVQIVGFVPTLDDYFNKVRLSVVPLRFGAGMKGKVVSSLAYGLPVVSSTIGIEGSGILADEHVLVADDPALFASKIIQLYEDQILWERLSNSGVDFANKNFSKESVLEKLVAIVE